MNALEGATFDTSPHNERITLEKMAGLLIHLLLCSWIFQSGYGSDCFPCRCDLGTLDCTGVDFIPPDHYEMMPSFQKVVMPASLINRRLVDLEVLIQPTDTRECVTLCRINGLRSTCLCQVSFYI